MEPGIFVYLIHSLWGFGGPLTTYPSTDASDHARLDQCRSSDKLNIVSCNRTSGMGGD